MDQQQRNEKLSEKRNTNDNISNTKISKLHNKSCITLKLFS
jgi:hypothetical protein